MSELIRLNTDDPHDCAKRIIIAHYSRHGQRTICFHNEELFIHEDGYYQKYPHRSLQRKLYDILRKYKHATTGKRIIPTPRLVREITEIIKTLTDHVHPSPSYLGDCRELDGHPAREFVPMRNGLYHWPTKKFYPSTSGLFITYRLDFDYIKEVAEAESLPEAKYWEAFLRSSLPDPQARDTLEESIGYYLSGDRHLQKCCSLIGESRAGKGTIARAITGLLGTASVVATSLSALNGRFGLEPLIGKPLAIISDLHANMRPSDNSLAYVRLKCITGEDKVDIDRKNIPAVSMTLPTRFLILGNDVDALRGIDSALADRIVLINFPVSHAKQPNYNLDQLLETEYFVIFLRARAAYDRLMKRGHFIIPDSAQSSVAALAEMSNPLHPYVSDRCILGPDKRVGKDVLREDYEDWCMLHDKIPLSRSVFGKYLRKAVRGVDIFRPRNFGGQHRGDDQYTGVGLKETQERQEDSLIFRNDPPLTYPAKRSA